MPLSAETPAPVNTITPPSRSSAVRHAAMTASIGYYSTMVRRFLVLVALAGCSRASDEAKKSQAGPPPREVEIPANLSIAVAVAGGAKPPITADTLRTVKPDFTDAEHKVWLIPTLVADAAQPGSIVEASA